MSPSNLSQFVSVCSIDLLFLVPQISSSALGVQPMDNEKDVQFDETRLRRQLSNEVDIINLRYFFLDGRSQSIGRLLDESLLNCMVYALYGTRVRLNNWKQGADI